MEHELMTMNKIDLCYFQPTLYPQSLQRMTYHCNITPLLLERDIVWLQTCCLSPSQLCLCNSRRQPLYQTPPMRETLYIMSICVMISYLLLDIIYEKDNVWRPGDHYIISSKEYNRQLLIVMTMQSNTKSTNINIVSRTRPAPTSDKPAIVHTLIATHTY
ncbi:hypothetical protein QTP88_026152 [Uroleucon formosanum]